MLGYKYVCIVVFFFFFPGAACPAVLVKPDNDGSILQEELREGGGSAINSQDTFDSTNPYSEPVCYLESH